MSRIYDDDLTTSFFRLYFILNSLALLSLFFEPLVQTSHIIISKNDFTYRLCISHLSLLSYSSHTSQ